MSQNSTATETVLAMNVESYASCRPLPSAGTYNEHQAYRHSEGATTDLHPTAPSVYRYYRYLHHFLPKLMVVLMAVVAVAAVVAVPTVVVVAAEECGPS